MDEVRRERSSSTNKAEVDLPILDLKDYLNWTPEMVVQWCVHTLQLDENDQLCVKIRSNRITGDLLPDLSLDDCKELCQVANSEIKENSDIYQEGLIKAIRLKIMLNKLKGNSSNNTNGKSSQQLKQQLQREQMIVTSLDNIYLVVESKFQDFQSQFNQLKVEVSDLTKHVSSLKNYSDNHIHNTNENIDESIIHSKNNWSTSNIKTSIPSKTIESQPISVTSKTSIKHLTHSLSRTNLNNNHDYYDKSTKLESVPNQSSPVQHEALKQLRASKDDSSEKILKSAMRKHNLNDEDWRQYVLVIGYGDKERILELHENPVVIFKTLKQQGFHPTIMLRRRGDFEELQSNDLFTNNNDNITPGGRL